MKVNLQKKKLDKLNIPFLGLFTSGRKSSKAVITVPIIPVHILFSAQILNEYLYVDVCNNLLKHI